MAKRNFFYGTMQSSKSAQLLIQAFNLERQGKTLVIFKSSTDTRDTGVIKSRALDEERPAILIHPKDVNKMYDICTKEKPCFVFVDETQFMTPVQVEELARIAIELDIPIFAYGLMLSYTGELFDGTKKAIECGFTMHELKMQCDLCTEKATHHLLYFHGWLMDNGQKIVVDDDSAIEYRSVCYPCYVEAQNNKSKK